ncbi:uncharacterized protein P174DRAFT_444447 [Aspergillus novofumigatus IBT 16806]|uniref:Uncharacterized protein n=1 Tax=Aspergillus novofumigatus (strain IBT 16806) TaxID=1392255 RepID=A0A2I1BZ66_ASPN1|nr:uncharacterized protein P174DRAFT_444447 [Aspergillus novofumigatus IBT 16806]PKX90682.1 hypothetical protein P174DRAFT_444447 [Aspergillus novofumigatus IBT 16806]
MSSTGHQGPFAEPSSESQTVLLPANPSVSRSSEPLPDPPSGSSQGRSSEKPWKPSINRQQSWSEQDQKHELQSRLLATERGKETGFTETLQDM